jgi:release factor glutamine methyltransferase
MDKTRTIKYVTRYIKDELDNIYPEPEINSLIEIMMDHVVKLKKTDLLVNREQTITYKQFKKIEDITKQLKKQKPIQQILEKTEFYNITLKISPQTLIPRQETEELVDWIIKDAPPRKINILDVGTGSGCIAIALAKNIRLASVTAIDYKQEIIDIAKENAELNDVGIRFICSNILNEELPNETYDLIVSNPPYVRPSERKFMKRNVLDFEPYEALFVKDHDPLIFYRKIVELAGEQLRANGFFYFEINEHLGQEMASLMKKYKFRNICLKKDLNNKDRMIKAQK